MEVENHYLTLNLKSQPTNVRVLSLVRESLLKTNLSPIDFTCLPRHNNYYNLKQIPNSVGSDSFTCSLRVYLILYIKRLHLHLMGQLT